MGKTSSRSELSARSDAKFEKKLQFYAKVRDTVASLSVQKAISKMCVHRVHVGDSEVVVTPFVQVATYARRKVKKKVRSRKRKLKAYDLSSLSEFLPELKTPRQPTPTEFKLNRKSRQNLVLKEASQFRTVLNHPTFQSDPLAAIHQHLQSTQPVTDEKPARKNAKSGAKAKKKKSKASPRLHSMEI